MGKIFRCLWLAINIEHKCERFAIVINLLIMLKYIGGSEILPFNDLSTYICWCWIISKARWWSVVVVALVWGKVLVPAVSNISHHIGDTG